MVAVGALSPHFYQSEFIELVLSVSYEMCAAIYLVAPYPEISLIFSLNRSINNRNY